MLACFSSGDLIPILRKSLVTILLPLTEPSVVVVFENTQYSRRAGFLNQAQEATLRPLPNYVNKHFYWWSRGPWVLNVSERGPRTMKV